MQSTQGIMQCPTCIGRGFQHTSQMPHNKYKGLLFVRTVDYDQRCFFCEICFKCHGAKFINIPKVRVPQEHIIKIRDLEERLTQEINKNRYLQNRLDEEINKNTMLNEQLQAYESVPLASEAPPPSYDDFKNNQSTT